MLEHFIYNRFMMQWAIYTRCNLSCTTTSVIHRSNASISTDIY